MPLQKTKNKKKKKQEKERNPSKTKSILQESSKSLRRTATNSEVVATSDSYLSEYRQRDIFPPNMRPSKTYGVHINGIAQVPENALLSTYTDYAKSSLSDLEVK